MTHTAEEPLVLSEVTGSTGHLVLNRPRQLNALSGDMFREIRRVLAEWAEDPAVQQVLVTSASPKAFCAGGDIKEIRQAVLDGGAEAGSEIFAVEYGLNGDIAHYPKPYVVLMNGICMGGGLGLSAHGSHRVVSPSSVLAMPETKIGFFPDIGASWFLTRLRRGEAEMPAEQRVAVARYLGLTGARITGHDAVALGLADTLIDDGDWDALAEAVIEEGYESALAAFARKPGPSEILDRWDEIVEQFGGSDVDEVLARTADQTAGMSPSSLVRTVLEFDAALADTDVRHSLARELRLASDTIAQPDFVEGVRTVVVDKGDTPVWNPATVAEVDADHIRTVLAD